MTNLYEKSKQSAFTIVELILVIVIIGILSGITMIAYTGVTKKAAEISLQSDLSNSAEQLKLFKIKNNEYPLTISSNCITNPTNTTNLCLKSSPGNSYVMPYERPTTQSFGLTEVNGNNTYHITENSTATLGAYIAPAVSLAISDPTNWMVIGTQVWAKANLNVGTMVTGTTEQTNNGGTNTVEKYCYNNIGSNCTTYGGLYQWNEAMKYDSSEGAQGLCPTNSHIPTDNDWKILEIQLGMTQIEADKEWTERGTDQATQLKPGGSSGLNMWVTGFRYPPTPTAGFTGLVSDANMWSSTSNTVIYKWIRGLSPAATIYRGTSSSDWGHPVRCVGN